MNNINKFDVEKYDNQIDVQMAIMAKNIVADVYEMINNLPTKSLNIDYNKYRVEVGSYRNESPVLKRVYIDKFLNQVVLDCINWVDERIVFDGDINKHIYNVGEINLFNYIKIYNVVSRTLNESKIEEIKVETLDVMSEFNGHDESLVRKIRDMVNKAINARNDCGIMTRFYTILTNLANDYIDKVNEKIVKENITLPDITKEFVKKYSYEILTEVCDNNDLKTILSYCRWKQYKYEIK